jgi:RES domain-containing protein
LIRVWRIATDTPDYGADDLTGAGAKVTGGRWNRAGTALVYGSENIALACLETFIHLKAGGLPLNRYLVQIEIPDAVWKTATRLAPAVGWDAIPTGRVSLDAGDAWAAACNAALLLVPSVIVPEERNILINPLHPDAKGIKAKRVRKWNYDGRMSRMGTPSR